MVLFHLDYWRAQLTLAKMDLVEAMQDSYRMTLADYTQRENENRNLARIAITDEARIMYTREADMYMMRIHELRETRLNQIRQNTTQIIEAVRQRAPAPQQRTPTAQQRTVRTLQRTRDAAATAARVAPATTTQRVTYRIPDTKPINVPDNIPDDIPNEFLCPITTELMRDPVMLTDGHVYEKQAIKRWLDNHNTSPLTKAVVDKTIMIPCFVLRKLIEEYMSGNKNTNENKEAKPKSEPKREPKTEPKEKKKREPTRYNLYVKESIKRMKDAGVEGGVKEWMKKIGEEWKQVRQQELITEMD